jgi:hypothetical protein
MTTQPIDEVKAKLGTAATFVWLGGGALLFLIDGGIGNLFTLKALLFLGVGMFVAAFLVGLLSYKVFLRLADRAALAAGAEGARVAVLRTVKQCQLISAAASLFLVIWCYISFFKEF